MIHAREDYNRIQDPAGLIPENEPVFLIRGHDPAAPETLEAYADFAEEYNAQPELVKKAREHAKTIALWQMDHPGSVHPADL